MSRSPASKSPSEQLREVIDAPLVLGDLDEPADVVPLLAPQTFVKVAKQLRDEGRLELLLPYATAEQLTSLFDIDAWNEDRVDLARARGWLLAIAEAYHASKPRGALADLVYEMDPEMWTYALLDGTTVIDLDPDDDASRDLAAERLSDARTWQSPDGFFVIGVGDDAMGHAALQILNYLYGDNLAEGRKIALSIESAIASEIEEELLRFRSGRLADLGFVAREEAMKLFRPLDHRAAAEAEPRDFRYLKDDDAEVGAGALVGAWAHAELLRGVMARLSDAEHGLRAREFLLLVNEVMAAQRFAPGNEALQERAIDQTRSTISIGLEMLATTRAGHPDPEAFLADRVREIGLRDVFRVGYGALDKLRRAALTLEKNARISLTRPASLLDRPWGPAVAAIMWFYPEVALQSTSRGTRPFRSLADVARATQTIAEAEALTRITFAGDGFAVDPGWLTRLDEPERIVLGDLVRTAIIHAHLPGSRTAMAPLGPADLAWARQELLRGGELVPEVRRDFEARAQTLGLGEHTAVLADNVLTRLRVELLGLEIEDDAPDLTKVSGLLTIQQVSMWLKVRAGDEGN